MKNDKLNTIEIETLSAYLDHELSEREETQLRERLASDADLRNQLEDLRLTRYTLRHTPKVRRQRSFTLSPEMVRKQTTAWRALTISRMVSVATSVLFAFVVVGEVLFSGSAGLLAAAPAEDTAMVESAEEMEAPMMMQASDENLMGDSAEEQSMAAEAAPMEEPAADMAAESTLPSGMGGGVEPTEIEAPAAELEGTPEPGGGGGAPPTAVPTATVGMQDRTMPSQKATGETGLAEDGMLDDTAMADEIAESAPMEQMGDTELSDQLLQEEQPEPIPTIRWIQAVLLALAIFFGAAAIYFRRTVR